MKSIRRDRAPDLFGAVRYTVLSPLTATTAPKAKTILWALSSPSLFKPQSVSWLSREAQYRRHKVALLLSSLAWEANDNVIATAIFVGKNKTKIKTTKKTPKHSYCIRRTRDTAGKHFSISFPYKIYYQQTPREKNRVYAALLWGMRRYYGGLYHAYLFWCKSECKKNQRNFSPRIPYFIFLQFVDFVSVFSFLVFKYIYIYIFK